LIARERRAAGAVLRVGFKEAVAYRAELLVWILATTMPLVMLALFSAVARDAPLGGYGQLDFVAYFLATFIVRQLTGAWSAWQINMDIREGAIATRLLRPFPPLLVYGLEGLAALPLRFLLSLPIAGAVLLATARDHLSHEPAAWALFVLAVIAGWLITLGINFAIGCLAFFVDSALRVMDIYLALFMVASGYLIPVDLFPPAARAIVERLPFRHQIALGVELMTGRYDHDLGGAARAVATSWAWVFGIFVVVFLVWRRGLRRYGAFGG